MYDVSWVNPCYPFQLAMAVSGISTLLMPLATTYGGLVLYSTVFGLADGGIGSSGFILSAKLLSEEERALGFALLCLLTCFSYAGGAPLGGKLQTRGMLVVPSRGPNSGSDTA